MYLSKEYINNGHFRIHYISSPLFILLGFWSQQLIKKNFAKERTDPFSYQDSMKRKDISEQNILAMHKTLAHHGTLQTPKRDLNSGRLNSIVYTLNHPQCTAGPLYSSIHPKLEQIGESLGRLVKTHCSPPLGIPEVRQSAFLKNFQVALILLILRLLLKGLKLACWLSLK